MPDTDILVSELPDTIAENSTDLVMLTQPDAQSDTGYSTAKTTLEKVALKGLHGIEYETLLPKFASGGRNITDAINQLLSNLADDYSTSSTYSVGDCVIYNGKIYECITDISVAEAWNSSHWTQIKAVDAGAGGGGDQKIAETKSGAIVNFETSLELPLDELKAEIVAQQAGSGTPSPINVRAIRGWNSVGISHTGKNLFNGEFYANSAFTDANFNTGTSNNKQKSIKLWLDAGTYTISFGGSNSIRIIRELFDGGYSTQAYQDLFSYTFTTTTRGNVGLSFIREDNENWEDVNIQIEKGSQATAYEPFGTTDIINLPSTIYGGSVDNKGNLVVTHGCVDLGDLAWSNFVGGSLKMIYMQFPDCPTPINNLTRASLICSNMPTKSRSEIRYSEPYDDGIGIDASGNLFVAYPSGSWTDLANAKTGLSGWYMCYELATPITLAITSQDIPTLLGENNIFADCGDVTVKYFTTDASDTVDLIKAVGGVKRTVLMDTWNDFANGTTITLSEDVDNFDELIIYASHLENNTYYAHRGIMRVDRETILWSISESAYSDEWRGLIDCIGSYQNNQVYSAFNFRFTDKRTMKSVSKTVGTWPYAQCGIEKIIGVKYN